jgi:hypothetical protein
MNYIIKEISGLYKVIMLKEFRRTEGVAFDVLVKSMIPRVDAIDRVIHKGAAVSPGPVGDVERPWYMHTHQDDNLFVLAGERHIEVYSQVHGKVEVFDITPESVMHNGELLYEGPALLVWPKNVFHRINSGKDGSASINLATHYDGFDIRTNFNIYDLNTTTGDYNMIRQGFQDQK